MEANVEMTVIRNKTFDEERALYGARGVRVLDCRFDGPADGESAFKEGSDISAERCYFNLRYPFWHDERVKILDSELTELCRAALWYTHSIEIERTKLHGIKALRECGEVTMRDCDIVSSEFGWSVRGVDMERCTAKGEYFMLRASNLRLSEVALDGKYSFQYIENAVFDRCQFDTKDAFWHAKNVVVRNSVVKGEYLAWYCENVTFENCKIIGTQPLCYCKGLRLVDCEMVDADLAFEKSELSATLKTPVLSIKNPRAGWIELPAAQEIIVDDPSSNCKIICTDSVNKSMRAG